MSDASADLMHTVSPHGAVNRPDEAQAARLQQVSWSATP